MKDRDGFALYLETSGPGEIAKRMRTQVGEAIVETIRVAWSGKLLSIYTTPKEVEAALGMPDIQQGLIMSYALFTRPGYLYTFEFDPEHEHLQRSGYQRVGPSPAPPPIPTILSGWPQYSLRLAELRATASEVSTWLGEPMERYGWWPIETWQYPTGLLINMRHGVVESDDVEEP